MRCPSCAAETPDGSRFCGICGYKLERVSPPPPILAGGQRSGVSGAGVSSSSSSSSSALALPVSRGAWWLRVLALLLVDAALFGAGVVLIVSYLDAREQASRARPAAGPAASMPAEPTRAQAADEATQQQISRAVKGLEPDIQRCYSQATQAAGQNRPPEGRLHIGLTFAADGRVTRAAAVVDDLASPSLTRCVEALFQGLRLPERPGGAPVETTWPLRFQAPG